MSLIMKTIVVGLGNPNLGDYGVGWKVANEIKRQLSGDASVDIECLSVGGLGLMEHLISYQRAILIDAFNMPGPLGSISTLKLSDLPNYSAFHVTSAQDVSLLHALELGKSMGAQLPDDVIVVGIATQKICDFSEELSLPVANAIPQATQIVLNLLKKAITVL
jgi:hydrogenase maturation protease